MTISSTKYHKDTTKSLVKQQTALRLLSSYIDKISSSTDYSLTSKLITDLSNLIETDLLIFNSDYQKIIKSVCATFNASHGFYIPSVLSAISTAIGKNIVIQDDRGVKEKAAFYMCIVADSGTGKTPSANWCIRPLKRIESEKREAYRQEKEAAEALDQRFTKTYKATYITDATTEALTSRLNNSDGILYFRDELIGWLKDMNKYRSGGSDDLLFMEMWNTDTTISVERTSKSIYIENPYLNILGGTQPKRLNEFMKKTATESGFFQRILFCYPKCEIQKRTGKKENKELKNLYDNLITDIYKKCQNLETEVVLEISDTGNKLITDFVNNFIFEQKILYKSNSLLVECLSKLETYILRFALIFEMMDTNEINWTGLVSDNSIIKSIATVLYFYQNTHKVLYTNSRNSLYTNDSDRIIHSILSSKFQQGEAFTTSQAVNVVNKKFSRVTVSKHLRDTGKFLYESLGRGKYSLL